VPGSGRRSIPPGVRLCYSRRGAVRPGRRAAPPSTRVLGLHRGAMPRVFHPMMFHDFGYTGGVLLGDLPPCFTVFLLGRRRPRRYLSLWVGTPGKARRAPKPPKRSHGRPSPRPHPTTIPRSISPGPLPPSATASICPVTCPLTDGNRNGHGVRFPKSALARPYRAPCCTPWRCKNGAFGSIPGPPMRPLSSFRRLCL
jgi:hypothetical protein